MSVCNLVQIQIKIWICGFLSGLLGLGGGVISLICLSGLLFVFDQCTKKRTQEMTPLFLIPKCLAMLKQCCFWDSVHLQSS